MDNKKTLPLRLSNTGYLQVYDRDKKKYVMEHKRVWETKYGPTPKGFEIHHINGVRTDNRLENLILLSRLEHKRVHSGCYKKNFQWYKPCRKCRVHKLVSQHYYKRKDGSVSPWCKGCCIKNATKNRLLRGGRGTRGDK